MKKRLFACLLLAVLLLLALPLSARAEARLDYVNDYAGILADGTRQSLNDRAAQISRAYDCGVYIVVVDDYRDYVNGGIEDFSEAIYKEYELGEGEAKDGILLAMSMDDRDYDITAYGDFANYAFTDYGKDQLASTMLDNFRADDWAGGFADFIDNAGTLTAYPLSAYDITPDEYCEAVLENPACMALHEAFTSAGFAELASEWWHFADEETEAQMRVVAGDAGLDFVAQ